MRLMLAPRVCATAGFQLLAQILAEGKGSDRLRGDVQHVMQKTSMAARSYSNRLVVACLLFICSASSSVLSQAEVEPTLSNERVVFQLESGDFEFAFFPEVAPVTTAHIFKLVQLGLYTTNHIFRVDKGFVAQVADVAGSRQLHYMNEQQKEHATKKVPLEVRADVKHHEGIVSMARGSSPDSGSSSFFVCYGDAPHLDMQYSAFGRITRGMEVLHALEKLPTKRQGIFVMPVERVAIVATYWYNIQRPLLFPSNVDDTEAARGSTCEEQMHDLRERLESQQQELQQLREREFE